MTDREPGWYWIKILNEWSCARWDGNEWESVDYIGAVEPDWIDDISPRIPTPDINGPMVTALSPGWYWMRLKGSGEWMAVYWDGANLYSPFHDGYAEPEWVAEVGPGIHAPAEEGEKPASNPGTMCVSVGVVMGKGPPEPTEDRLHVSVVGKRDGASPVVRSLPGVVHVDHAADVRGGFEFRIVPIPGKEDEFREVFKEFFQPAEIDPDPKG